MLLRIKKKTKVMYCLARLLWSF